jgi:hypothetical protein
VPYDWGQVFEKNPSLKKSLNSHNLELLQSQIHEMSSIQDRGSHVSNQKSKRQRNSAKSRKSKKSKSSIKNSAKKGKKKRKSSSKQDSERSTFKSKGTKNGSAKKRRLQGAEIGTSQDLIGKIESTIEKVSQSLSKRNSSVYDQIDHQEEPGRGRFDSKSPLHKSNRKLMKFDSLESSHQNLRSSQVQTSQDIKKRYK